MAQPRPASHPRRRVATHARRSGVAVRAQRQLCVRHARRYAVLLCRCQPVAACRPVWVLCTGTAVCRKHAARLSSCRREPARSSGRRAARVRASRNSKGSAAQMPSTRRREDRQTQKFILPARRWRNVALPARTVLKGVGCHRQCVAYVHACAIVLPGSVLSIHPRQLSFPPQRELQFKGHMATVRSTYLLVAV